MKNKINYKKGQIVLVVLLVTSAVMVMGLSLSRGSVKELKIDTNEETLKQTFNTAESGLDYFFVNNEKSYVANVGFSAEIDEDELMVGKNMENRKVVFYEPQFLKLDDYSGNLEIKLEENFQGSVKVDVFYKEEKIERYGYNFNDGSGDDSVDGFENNASSININIGSNPDFLVVTPLFEPTIVRFITTGNFPPQGKKIVSTGRSVDGIESRVSVEEVFEIPYFMLEGIVAEGDVLVTGN